MKLPPSLKVSTCRPNRCGMERIYVQTSLLKRAVLSMVKYRIKALDVLYSMVRGWSAKSCFWSGQGLGQTSPDFGKCDLDPVLRVFWVWWTISGRLGLVRATSFCVPTPEKIPGIKIGLWQLPFLCLLFLGTRNAGQTIKWLNFCSLEFSRFSCQLVAVVQFISVRVLALFSFQTSIPKVERGQIGLEKAACSTRWPYGGERNLAQVHHAWCIFSWGKNLKIMG